MAFKFIYDLDVVALAISSACCVLAVISGFSFLQSRRKGELFFALGMLLLTISSYETFNAVFVIMVPFCAAAVALFTDKKPKESLPGGLKARAYAGCSAGYILSGGNCAAGVHQ